MKREYKLGLYVQYDLTDGAYSGLSFIKKSNDAYKSNLDSQLFKLELVTDDPDLIYNDIDTFDFPKKIDSFFVECEICGISQKSDNFIHINNPDDESDLHCTQCWDCA